LRRGGFPYIISWKVQIWWSVTCLVAVALPLLLIDNTKVQRTCRGKKNKKFLWNIVLTNTILVQNYRPI
jgi:hypothetical protein